MWFFTSIIMKHSNQNRNHETELLLPEFSNKDDSDYLSLLKKPKYDLNNMKKIVLIVLLLALSETFCYYSINVSI